MKVILGKYKNWFGPFQLAEKLWFWEKDKDKDKIHKLGEWLAYGKIEPKKEIGDIHNFLKIDENPTLLYKFLSWIDKFRKRKQIIRIDPWDTWSMDRTLAPIILPMLKQLRETQHSYPLVDLIDLPIELQFTWNENWESQKTFDFYHEDDEDFFNIQEKQWNLQWNYILDQMIYSFERIVDNSWEDKFHSGNIDMQSKVIKEDGTCEIIKGPNDTHEFDVDGYKLEQEKISNGLKLFGKYYQNLWD